MIALLPFSVKIGRSSITVLEGKPIPYAVMKNCDIDEMIKKGIIEKPKKEAKKPEPKKESE